MTLSRKLRRVALIGVAMFAVGCAPARPNIPAGQQGLTLDMTAFNAGQCDFVGPNITVEKESVLGGDYFKVVGHVTRSTLRCIMPDGQAISTTSHHQLYEPGRFDYSALIVGRITGPGEAIVYGYSDGPGGKVDTEGKLIFVPSR